MKLYDHSQHLMLKIYKPIGEKILFPKMICNLAKEEISNVDSKYSTSYDCESSVGKSDLPPRLKLEKLTEDPVARIGTGEGETWSQGEALEPAVIQCQVVNQKLAKLAIITTSIIKMTLSLK